MLFLAENAPSSIKLSTVYNRSGVSRLSTKTFDRKMGKVKKRKLIKRKDIYWKMYPRINYIITKDEKIEENRYKRKGTR